MSNKKLTWYILGALGGAAITFVIMSNITVTKAEAVELGTEVAKERMVEYRNLTKESVKLTDEAIKELKKCRNTLNEYKENSIEAYFLDE